MTRRKTEIKRIDNRKLRHVTFSKRRGGLFKKAQELAILCDIEIGLVVFSDAGKLFNYASTSMQEVIERYNRQKDVNGPGPGFPNSGLQSDAYNKLRKEVADKSHELRRLKGLELHGCTLQELEKLEKRVAAALNGVSKAKDERVMQDIDVLKQKELQLKEENRRLKQSLEQGQSSEPVNKICCSSDCPQDPDSSRNFLRLGLPLLK